MNKKTGFSVFFQNERLSDSHPKNRFAINGEKNANLCFFWGGGHAVQVRINFFKFIKIFNKELRIKT